MAICLIIFVYLLLPAWQFGDSGEALEAVARRDEKDARVFGAGSPTPHKCGIERAMARAALLSVALMDPLPSREILSDRMLKYEHVTKLQKLPNYLSQLYEAGIKRQGRGKRLYLNLGARGVKDKSTTFFESYPDAAAFEHHAFDAAPHWAQDMGWEEASVRDRRMKLHNVAVWTHNTTLSFGLRKSASHVVANASDNARSIFGADDRKIKESYDVPAIDLGIFLAEHTTPDDFVLVKMDIEGAEFAVVPHLISSGAACLIDEMYLECHSGSDIAKGRSYDDCITMLVALRGMGVATHLWF